MTLGVYGWSSRQVQRALPGGAARLVALNLFSLTLRTVTRSRGRRRDRGHTNHRAGNMKIFYRCLIAGAGCRLIAALNQRLPRETRRCIVVKQS
jgi:hypothetical protein